jgi:hypothetical protein
LGKYQLFFLTIPLSAEFLSYLSQGLADLPVVFNFSPPGNDHGVVLLGHVVRGKTNGAHSPTADNAGVEAQNGNIIHGKPEKRQHNNHLCHSDFAQNIKSCWAENLNIFWREIQILHYSWPGRPVLWMHHDEIDFVLDYAGSVIGSVVAAHANGNLIMYF